MEIYKKLLAARDIIKNTKVKKEGKNTFSGYEYFTPSQISQIVHSACHEVGLLHLYRLEKTDNGYRASLKIVDISKPDYAFEFEIPTSIPDIKATNEAQKLGGAVTYSERYLLMIAFDIVDNSLDFDTTENANHQVKPGKKEPAKKNMQVIPEITERFDFTKWNGVITENKTIIYSGNEFALSETALNQLNDFLSDQEHTLKMQAYNQQLDNDLDFLNNMKK